MWINKIIRRVGIEIKGEIYLHRRFGVSYFQIFKSLLMKNNIITVPIKNLSVDTALQKSLIKHLFKET